MNAATAPIRPATEEAIAEAARLLREGRLVAFPTETVYGLGADATSDAAVARLFAAKGRPRFNPLIVHFADAADIAPHGVMDGRARALAEKFWPGPLTLVLARTPGTGISALVSAGLETIAVRVPAHPVARALIAAAGVPLAAPSANRSGDISPTTAAHVARSLDGAPAMILDAGPTPVGIESTVIDLSGPRAALLRPGGLAREAIEAVTGPLAVPADEEKGDGPARAPGRLGRHYAPHLPLRLEATELRQGEALLAFGPNLPAGAGRAVAVLNLSPTGDVIEAAANLFAMLHALDASGAKAIAAMKVPEAGLGAAINDRLRRAVRPLPDSEPGD
jgi:L-threonylcarbamoyladenylate synthase